MGKRKTVRRSKRSAEPWEPSPTQLEIYADVSRGLAQRDVAKIHGVKQPAVSKICKRIEEWLVPQMMESIREIKARHTAHLMHVFQEAMAAWERSKLPAFSTTRKESEENGDERTRTKKGQTGNSTYLSEARAALKEIRQIWGADAPIEVQHSGEIRVAGMSAEEMKEHVASQLDDARKMIIEVKPE